MTPTAEASKDETLSVHPAPDAWRVEVFRRAAIGDPEGAHVAAAMGELGLARPAEVRVAKGYLLAPGYAKKVVDEIATQVLADPVVNEVRVLAPRAAARSGTGHRILVMPRPGVMDPVAHTLEDLLARSGRTPQNGSPAVATYRVFELRGTYAREELAQLSAKLLANETIEVVRVDREDLPYGERFPSALRGRVEVPLLRRSDEELVQLSREGQLSLSLTEMRAIQAHFSGLKREPSACELETLAQTWSEHCKHKTFTGVIDFTPPEGGPVQRIDNLLKSTIARATFELAKPWCVSVFKDNAGIVAFDQGQDLCIKVETHNHPSAIDPYGGAGTGIGGVIRDVLGAGRGARPIANTDAFFVGPPDLPKERVPKGTMHPRRILRGVVAGVRDYGNRMGIPTVSGGVWFDEGYTANPLVYAGTIGILPHADAEKEVRSGDVIVSVGGRTGRDGIHGATFSSVELSEHSETVSSSAVQIGDPITEKRTLDCLLVARDRGLYRALTDCGAGGYSSAVGEMGENTGAEVELEDVHLKYPGLASHEIWISEAQERMVLAVPPEHVDELVSLFAAEDVEATVLGRFTDTQRLVVKDRGAIVCELDMRFLHGGNPRPVRSARWTRPEHADPGCAAPTRGHARTLLALLALPEVASKEWIVRQYDHEVQGNSVVKSLVGVHGDAPSDAAVLQPLASSRMGVAIACGANPRFGVLDPYAMALAVIDEALRNAVAVGADPARVAILDNFSWGNCDKPDRLGSLVLASQGCYDAAKAFGTPFVSGKDSLNNEYRVGDETLSIPPTLLITALGIVPDVARCVSMDAKRAGNRVYVVGATRPELGGSLLHELEGRRGGRVPRVELARAPRLFAALHAAVRAGCVASCHDLSEGGLALAAAEMAFGGELGLALDLAQLPVEGALAGADTTGEADTWRLFAESCSRFLVEVTAERAPEFERLLAGLPCAALGEVRAEPVLSVRGTAGRALFEVPVAELRRAFHSAFQG
ncbi:MAG: phosphoribosylformylglycinamidine synthase subunit PurL [Planctomycetes bacterium]|nr:phosphoribosylformylglycinamidine synthase subunit PurL [Planctomycetota bacterium]